MPWPPGQVGPSVGTLGQVGPSVGLRGAEASVTPGGTLVGRHQLPFDLQWNSFGNPPPPPPRTPHFSCAQKETNHS